MKVAEWLTSRGEHKMANDIRSVCRSLRQSRETNSRLHADNMALRREERLIAAGAPSEDVLALDIALELTGDLKRNLEAAVAERGVPPVDLLADVISNVLRDNLFAAVIDT